MTEPQDVLAEALREAVAWELFDDTPNDKHGQLCPIWTRRPERRRKNEAGPAWTDCDCWQLRLVRHLADIALGAPALRAALVRTPETLDGTTTDCPLEGVHEHAFRGPHRFHEWDPSYFTLNDRPPVRTPETLDAGTCWFCKGEFVVDALIAGYDTFEEQRLACLACNERMSGNWRPAASPAPDPGAGE